MRLRAVFFGTPDDNSLGAVAALADAALDLGVVSVTNWYFDDDTSLFEELLARTKPAGVPPDLTAIEGDDLREALSTQRKTDTFLGRCAGGAPCDIVLGRHWLWIDGDAIDRVAKWAAKGPGRRVLLLVAHEPAENELLQLWARELAVPVTALRPGGPSKEIARPATTAHAALAAAGWVRSTRRGAREVARQRRLEGSDALAGRLWTFKESRGRPTNNFLVRSHQGPVVDMWTPEDTSYWVETAGRHGVVQAVRWGFDSDAYDSAEPYLPHTSLTVGDKLRYGHPDHEGAVAVAAGTWLVETLTNGGDLAAARARRVGR